MPQLPTITYRKFIKKLKKAGFIFAGQAKGSHEIWFNTQTKRFVSVPRHEGKTIKKGTLHGMVKDIGLTVEEFINL